MFTEGTCARADDVVNGNPVPKNSSNKDGNNGLVFLRTKFMMLGFNVIHLTHGNMHTIET
jgi:hypothetical protein